MRLQRRQLMGLINLRGVGRFRRVYRTARNELEAQLAALEAAGRGQTFTAHQMRMVLAQVTMVTGKVQSGIAQNLEGNSRLATTTAGRHLVGMVDGLSRRFGRVTPVIPATEVAAIGGMLEGVDPMLLRRYRMSAATYGPQAVDSIQKGLAQSIIQRETVDQAVNRIRGSSGLFQRQAWRAERIVRTEMSYTYGLGKQRSMERLKQTVPELGKMQKRLVATFDSRTGDDSKELNGQTVDIDKPFVWVVKDSKGRPTGKVVQYMQPPNRPQDREIVIPWMEGWDTAGVKHPGPVKPSVPRM